MICGVPGPQGKQYYVVTLHRASPLDDQEEAQAAASGAASPANPRDGFQLPSGFVLKGTLLERLLHNLHPLRVTAIALYGHSAIYVKEHISLMLSLRYASPRLCMQGQSIGEGP